MKNCNGFKTIEDFNGKAEAIILSFASLSSLSGASTPLLLGLVTQCVDHWIKQPHLKWLLLHVFEKYMKEIDGVYSVLYHPILIADALVQCIVLVLRNKYKRNCTFSVEGEEWQRRLMDVLLRSIIDLPAACELRGTILKVQIRLFFNQNKVVFVYDI